MGAARTGLARLARPPPQLRAAYLGTANGDNAGPLKSLLTMERPGCCVVAVQEHHSPAERTPPRLGRRSLEDEQLAAPAVALASSAHVGAAPAPLSAEPAKPDPGLCAPAPWSCLGQLRGRRPCISQVAGKGPAYHQCKKRKQ